MALLENCICFFRKSFGKFLKKWSCYLGNAATDVGNANLNTQSSDKGVIANTKDLVKEDKISEDAISLAQRTLLTKLYTMNQQIEVFKNDFPQEYADFLRQMEHLRKVYMSGLEEIRKQMTFEIDPEFDGQMRGEMQRLERSIQLFIDDEVKFHVLSKRLQMLIVKLNILYNVSISHPKEKQKVLSQLHRAIEIEMEMGEDFKESGALLEDSRKRDRIVTLISYVDYEIFKITLRNSDSTPEEIWKRLMLLVKFQDFDCVTAFKAFIEDELSDDAEWLSRIQEEEYHKAFSKQISSLQAEIAYAKSPKSKLLDESFWQKFFVLESSLLGFLKKEKAVEPQEAKIGLIQAMQIDVKESEVLTLPKTNAYLALLHVFSVLPDNRIWLLIQLFSKLSNAVTYREIYFLLLLFEAMDIMRQVPNSLNRYMKRYLSKYPYNDKEIRKRKRYVLQSFVEKEYIPVFSLREDPERVIATLQELQLDFKVEEEVVFLNSIYFQGLKNLFAC